MEWEKWRKARQVSSKNTGVEKIVGKDLHFWAEFYRNNEGQLDTLLEGMLLDLRNSERPTAEEEAWIHTYKAGLRGAVKKCYDEEEAEKEQREAETKQRQEEASKRARNKPLI